MKASMVKLGILSANLVLIFFAPTCNAEIFKWVDTNGHTHYSENIEGAGESKIINVKVEAPPTSASTQPQKSPTEQVKDIIDKLHNMQKSSRPVFMKNNIRPLTLPHEAPESRDTSDCRLARNVISGAVKHKNGARTDQNDINTAKNDIRSFCH